MWAVVGDTVVDIVKFDCEYAINTIPKATAILPVGREVSTMLPSSAHLIANQTTIQIPTQVFCSVRYAGGDVSAILPVGDYLLFAGWTTGIGYRHTYGGLSMALDMTHWLSALTFSSTMSSASSPNNPAHFAFAGALAELDGTPGGYHIYANTLAHKYITPQGVEKDLWGEGIKPFLLALASSDRFNYEAFGGELKKNDSQGDDCKAALNAFTGDLLPMDAAGMGMMPDLLRNAIVDDLAFGTLTPSAKTEFMRTATVTFWDAIITMANEYRFAVIPFPHKALVVPYVAGLREHWSEAARLELAIAEIDRQIEVGASAADIFGGSLGIDTADLKKQRGKLQDRLTAAQAGDDFTILARDLDVYDMSTQLRAPLRAVGVYSGHASRCAFFGARQRMVPGTETCGGWYIARPDGLVKIQPAPQYMNLVLPAAHSKEAAAADGKKVKGTAVNPGVGDAPEEMAPKDKIAKQKGALDAYARALYATETLRARSGFLGGPLRFDICPGSTIKVEGTAGAFLAGVDPHGEPRFATVYRVRLEVDAQTPSAGASFDLSNVRTETENTNDDTSIDRHPLYDRVWTGDYLLSKSEVDQ